MSRKWVIVLPPFQFGWPFLLLCSCFGQGFCRVLYRDGSRKPSVFFQILEKWVPLSPIGYGACCVFAHMTLIVLSYNLFYMCYSPELHCEKCLYISLFVCILRGSFSNRAEAHSSPALAPRAGVAGESHSAGQDVEVYYLSVCCSSICWCDTDSLAYQS